MTWHYNFVGAFQAPDSRSTLKYKYRHVEGKRAYEIISTAEWQQVTVA